MQTEPATDGPTTGAPADAVDFGEWARPALLPMSRLARRLAPHADPDDVVQDALARAWQKREQFRADRGTPLTWLLAITADQARSSRRSRVRRLRVVDDTADVPDSAAYDRAANLDLERAIAALTERQQLAVHLHYFLGLSVLETAAVLHCSDGTVKSTLFDARSRLRAELGDHDD